MIRRHDWLDLDVPVGEHALRCHLGVPRGPVGLVVLAGVRDGHVAESLRMRALATLSVELAVIEAERYEIDLLASRLVAVTDWILARSSVAHLPIGYVGAGTSAAAVLVAAARRPDVVRAIALPGGRADLAGSALPIVRAPTLLVAPGDHEATLEIGRAAIEQMTTATQLAIIPGAGPRFEEPGALDEVVSLAAEWLFDHVPSRVSSRPPVRADGAPRSA